MNASRDMIWLIARKQHAGTWVQECSAGRANACSVLSLTRRSTSAGILFHLLGILQRHVLVPVVGLSVQQYDACFPLVPDNGISVPCDYDVDTNTSLSTAGMREYLVKAEGCMRWDMSAASNEPCARPWYSVPHATDYQITCAPRKCGIAPAANDDVYFLQTQ
jgi:hypothetical protein